MCGCVCVLGRLFFSWDFVQPHSGQIMYLDTEQSQEINLSPIQTSMQSRLLSELNVIWTEAETFEAE